MTVKESGSLGRRGEALAAAFLQQRGLTIVERGFRCRFGEIDLIACNRELLIFCEVKTRRQGGWTSALEAVSFAKRRRLIKTAGWYLSRSPWEGDLRFDVIAITAAREADEFELEWVENAFPWD
ncbi:MAG: YraN family protein [Deltaproteobacteria bacterium]|nr:YraN family protein [Deltaproteobacteria bacterium]